MVKILRLYTGLGFSFEETETTVVFSAEVSGDWFLDGVRMLQSSDTFTCEKAHLPAQVMFEAKLNGEYKRHTKWVEL